MWRSQTSFSGSFAHVIRAVYYVRVVPSSQRKSTTGKISVCKNMCNLGRGKEEGELRAPWQGTEKHYGPYKHYSFLEGCGMWHSHRLRPPELLPYKDISITLTTWTGPLENYEMKHLQQRLTLIKIHKLNLLQLLRFISCFCLELWGGDGCGEHRPWQTRVLTVQLSLEARSKDPAFLFGMRCADTFFSDLKLHESYPPKLRGHTSPADVPVLLVKRQSGNSSMSISSHTVRFS